MAQEKVNETMWKTGRYRFLCALLGVVAATAAYPYEVATHQQLSIRAGARSQIYLDTTILANAGMPGRSESVYPATTGGNTDILSLLAIGAAQEDTDYWARVFNHFFDVQYNNFAGRGMFVPPFDGHPSPDWAIEDVGEVSDRTLISGQNFSIRQLQQYYFSALTASTRTERIAYFARAIESAGHAIHHIQDMAQPQHVRNDQHVHPIPGTTINPDWSFYERYTQAYVTDARLDAYLASYPYTPPIFPTSRQYWHTPAVNSARYVGMAEFSSNNYVTFGRTFTGSFDANGGVTITGNSDSPLPGRTNIDGSNKTILPWTGSLTLSNGQLRTGTFDFVYGKVYDGHTGVLTSNQRLAGFSILDKFVSGVSNTPLSVGRQPAFTEDSEVYEDRYRVLLPRAVAFSAGLLDHAFRGRLDLARGSNPGSWVVTNLSGPISNGQVIPQAISGVLSLYYDDGQDVRRPIPGASSMTVNLSYGQSMQMNSLEPPSGATRIIAAFAGRIGSEGDASGSGFYATAGKIIAYSVPTIPCGQPFAAVGGSEGTTQYMDLGSAAGRVQGEFDAYFIPDSMVVRRSNSSGSVRFTTSGLVSGYHQFEFDHPGGSDPAANRIWIKVTGNSNTSTAWHSAISCPGQSLTNDGRIKKRINIRFSVSSGNADPNCGRGYYDVYIDSTLKGRMGWGAPGGSSLTGVEVTEGERHSLRLAKTTTTQSTPYAFPCVLTRPYLHVNGADRDISAHVNNELEISIP